MKLLRQINTSAAAIVLICFFLPWVQVSCGGAKDSLSGFDLSREGPDLLWLIPMLVGALVVSSLIRFGKEENKTIAFARTMCGVFSALLMNRERLRAHDHSALIAAQLTGWFWLGLISAVAVAVTGIAMLLRRQRAP
jgi:cytochrome b subunit of formate dehydrogenase